MHQQLAPQAAARVRTGEVFFAKAAGVEQRHRKRVAKRHLRGGAGGGCQVQRAGLLVNGAVERDVGMAGERRIAAAGHRHQRDAEPLDGRQDGGKLVAFPRV